MIKNYYENHSDYYQLAFGWNGALLPINHKTRIACSL